MSWDGSGQFTRTNGVFAGATVWNEDRQNSIKIVATRHDTHDEDLAQGINNCLAKDGQNAMTGPLNLGTQNIINGNEIQAREVNLNAGDRRIRGIDGGSQLSEINFASDQVQLIGQSTLGGTLATFSLAGLNLQGRTLSNGDVSVSAVAAGTGTFTVLSGTTINGKSSVQEEINGGSTGQYLIKNSNADRDFAFTTLTPSAVSDNFQGVLSANEIIGSGLAALPSGTGHWTEQVNLGSAFTFDTSNGELTINTAGTYQITYQLGLTNTSVSAVSSTNARAALWINGASLPDEAIASSRVNLANFNESQTIVVANYLRTMAVNDTIQPFAGNGIGGSDLQAAGLQTRLSVTRVA